MNYPSTIYEISGFNIIKLQFVIEHPNNSNYSIWLDCSTQLPKRIYNNDLTSRNYFSSDIEASNEIISRCKAFISSLEI